MASPALAPGWRSRLSHTGANWSAWRNFAIALVALAVALALALYSSAAAQNDEMWLASSSALGALALAAYVAVTIVPGLARRTALRWLGGRTDYHLTREGGVYLAGVMIVALAALNTGNNLLFMVLACLLAGILISGVLSQIALSGIELRVELPEHIFAGRAVVALAELVNHKQTLPSFSLRLVSAKRKSRNRQPESPENDVLRKPVYFPYIPRRTTVQQSVEMVFPRRGVYRQDALGLRTKFPFGFLEKTRRVDSRLEARVYPPVERTEEFYEVLPLVSGELESFLRGRGHDLYSIRDYQTSDSARFVDWKASAKTGLLQVREFAREDERRVLLALDSVVPSGSDTLAFERGVALCASLAWHFYEIDAVIGFRTNGFETPMAPGSEIVYDILGHLATAAPQQSPAGRGLLDDLADVPQIFKIVLTCQPHGSIPTSLWNSSYILFLDR